ncbi:MAG: hypothetical protein IJ555_01120 [Ruminococcus sp.]|nr:hypothetical protein [Ruminococcus sp.]MBR2284688.1 hypothetical protein [Ruminococcus sp.]
MDTSLQKSPAAPETDNGTTFAQGEKTLRILGKEELDWYIIRTADTLVYDKQLFRKFDGVMHMLNGIVYRPLDEDSFCNLAYQYALSENIILKPNHCRQLLESVLIRVRESPCGPDSEDYTVFKNGLISNRNGMPLQVIPSDYFATIYVNANYLPDRQLYHPTADAFLAIISGGDPELIARHWEFWGYVLSSDYHAKAIFSLFGETGNNGKSTELSFLRTFLPGAVDSMPIKTMTSRFGRHRIQHCRLEYSADEGAVNLSSESIGFLKSASGFDDMTADRKNREMVQFTCKCKIAIASNYNIGMAYAAVDQAFVRRLVTIPYPYSIPKEQQDPMILQKLLREKDAVATEAFRYYLRLKANNYQFTGHDRFDQLQTILTSPVNTEYNAVRDFSQTYCDFTDQSAFTTSQELFEAFTAHYQTSICDTTGFSQAFRLVNQDRIQSKRQHTSSYNLRGFTGVKLLMP